MNMSDKKRDSTQESTPKNGGVAESEKANYEQELLELRKSYVALEDEKQALLKELHDVKDAYLRTAAEYDNYRKRTTKERDAAFGNGSGFAVSQMLVLLDTLEVAVEAPTADEAYKKGVELVLAKAKQTFEFLGVQEIDAQDKAFDPNLHAAVSQEESDAEAGTIIKVLQKGYKMQDRVLRHASVVVAQ